MLFKLAWGNVRRASRDYLVYLLTLTLAVTVFYAFNTISIQVDYANVSDVGLSELLGGIMSGLTIFLAVVMGFLMVYANNFIMKRRKKEFGLYQVLGMGRGQVARVMALETVIVSVAALVLGVILGLALSQLMTFFTASLFKTQIQDFHFFFSPSAFLLTVGCLVAIFLVTLVFNLRVVARAKIIDLMSAGRVNETIKTRNPWVSAAVFIVGAVAIGVAYMRLLRDGMPIDGTEDGMQQFLITTVTVVAGTLLLFFGLSGFLLKVLQSARGVYWRGLNMFTMRQLSAKVNTVSFSVAIIAMILFLAITSVTGGMSIANVMNENVERTTPVDYSRTFSYFSQSVLDSFSSSPGSAMSAEEVEETYRVASEPIDMVEASKADAREDGKTYDLDSIARQVVQVDTYDSTPFGSTTSYLTLLDLADACGMELPKGLESSDATRLGLAFMGESDYNEYREMIGLDPVDLGQDGYLITCDLGNSVANIYNAALAQGYEIDLGFTRLHPLEDKMDEAASTFTNGSMGTNSGTVIMPDAVLDQLDLPCYVSYLLVDYREGLTTAEGDEYVRAPRSYGQVVDADGYMVGYWGVETTRTEAFESTNSMNGLISYLAIYIGFVLVIACAAILTIQQLSSVADGAKNYRILSELGTSQRQIMRSVLMQQAIFFVFPLVVGVAHSVVALHVVIELVELFGGITIAGTVGLTAVIFLLAYGGYFLVTYLMSKGIVNDAVRARHTV